MGSNGGYGNDSDVSLLMQATHAKAFKRSCQLRARFKSSNPHNGIK